MIIDDNLKMSFICCSFANIQLNEQSLENVKRRSTAMHYKNLPLTFKYLSSLVTIHIFFLVQIQFFQTCGKCHANTPRCGKRTRSYPPFAPALKLKIVERTYIYGGALAFNMKNIYSIFMVFIINNKQQFSGKRQCVISSCVYVCCCTLMAIANTQRKTQNNILNKKKILLVQLK